MKQEVTSSFRSAASHLIFLRDSQTGAPGPAASLGLISYHDGRRRSKHRFTFSVGL